MSGPADGGTPDPADAVTSVIVADDHTLFRQGLCQLIETDPLLRIVGQAGNGDEALRLTAALRPVVALLDVEMPGPGARALIRDTLRRAPGTKVVMLTMHDDPDLVRELLDAGASAYLVKSIARDELVAALRSVSRAESNVLLSVSLDTIEGMDGRTRALSDRELDVLALCAEALSNAQIAAKLYITEGTVKRHLTNTYRKLGAVSRLDAVRKARSARLLRSGPDI